MNVFGGACRGRVSVLCNDPCGTATSVVLPAHGVVEAFYLLRRQCCVQKHSALWVFNGFFLAGLGVRTDAT